MIPMTAVTRQVAYPACVVEVCSYRSMQLFINYLNSEYDFGANFQAGMRGRQNSLVTMGDLPRRQSAKRVSFAAFEGSVGTLSKPT